LTEQIGDIIVTCTGGDFTDGAPAPQVTIAVALTSQITTRLVNDSGLSEALLLIDEPGTTNFPPVPNYGSGAPLIPCPNTGPAGFAGCFAYGYHVNPGGAGIVYGVAVNPSPAGTTALPPSQTAINSATAVSSPPNAPNVYQGVVTGNQVTFFGVPVLAPGTNAARVFRITNLRVDAAASTPGQAVQAYISVSNPSELPISNAEPIVGFIQTSPAVQMLKPALSGPIPLALNGCLAVNPALAADPTSTNAPDGVSFVVRLSETYQTDFKPMGTPVSPAPDANSRPASGPQDIPGTIYGTETGFYNPAFPATNGLNVAGLATQGTRFLVQFQGLPTGMQIQAPVYERGQGLTTSRVRLISTDTNGNSSSYTPLGPLSSLNTYYASSMVYVYEVTEIANGVNPNAIDTIDLPFYIAYPGPGALPTSLGQVTANISYAPFSTISTADDTGAPIPRFQNVSAPQVVANVMACPTQTPTVSITSSANPGYFGQAVTFTAAVPTGATGSVQFSVDNASVGSAVTVSGSHRIDGGPTQLHRGQGKHICGSEHIERRGTSDANCYHHCK